MSGRYYENAGCGLRLERRLCSCGQRGYGPQHPNRFAAKSPDTASESNGELR